MRWCIAFLLMVFALPALAQETGEPADAAEERSFFLSFVEDRISTPNRQIRINNIEGVLSSEAVIGEITVADRDGVWLRISNASINWSRSTLVLRQRLQIARLAAESIEVLRKPLPDEGLPSPEARSFSVPELPIAMNIDLLEVEELSFGEDVFGLASTLSVEGNIRLADGSLDTALEIVRLDGPGGRLALEASYDNETRELALDVALSEPENGVLANLLDIEGRPALALTLAGNGPLDTLDLSLSLAAAGQTALEGTAALRQRDEGLGFTVDVGGPIIRLIPSRFRSFFGAETALAASGVAKDGGGLLLESLSLSSAALELEAAAETASDGFLTALSLNANISDETGEPVLLPVPGGETSVRSASLTATFGEAGSQRWQAQLDVLKLTTDSFAAESARLSASGEAANLSTPTERRVTFDIDGGVNGITAQRADVAEALGDAIRLTSSGAWQAGNPVDLTSLEISGQSLNVALSGDIDDFAFNGEIGVEAGNIAPFSDLAGRELAGSLNLKANGTLQPISGAFDLVLDGRADNLEIGMEPVNSLLAGATRITGGLARSIEGFTAEDFRIASDQFAFTADGTFSSEAADFGFEAALADLATLTDRASGRVTASGRARGTEGDLDLSFQALMPGGQLLDRRVSEGGLGFEGTLAGETLNGRLSGNAFLDGTRAQLQSDISLTADERRLQGLDFSAGGARLTGDLVQGSEGLVSGRLALNAADISTAATLFLIKAEGAIEAEIALEPRQNTQHASIQADVSGFAMEQISLGSAEAEATIADLFGVPAIDGTIAARDISAAGVDVAQLQARAATQGDTTSFSAEAALTNGTDLSVSGGLAPEGEGFRVSLDTLELAQAGVSARLLEPTTLSVVGDTVDFAPLRLDIGGGRLTAEGEIARTLDVSVSLDSVPLSLANAIRPDLALGGTLDGEADISGPRNAPEATFQLTGRDITAQALRESGIAALNVEATGTTRNEVLSVDASLTSPGGVRASVTGDIPFEQDELALDLELQAFPLALLNARFPDLALGGTLTGSSTVRGSLTAPRAQFSLNARGVTAAPLTQVGAAPLDVAASGRFADGAIVLETARATGGRGLAVTAVGRVPLTGSDMAVNVEGSLPLSLADRLLADRGAQATGTVNVNLKIGGSIGDPRFDGTVSTSGAAVVDPMTNLRVDDIRLDAAVTSDTVTIRSSSASLSRGGAVALSGTVSLNGTAGFPADLSIRLDEARYADGDLFTATLSGALTLNGPLVRDPLLAGRLTMSRAEIIVPDSFGSAASGINVRHVSPPADVRRTLERARADDGTPVPSGRPSVLRLDVTLDAPARIFVRGRGLDAELGGSVRLTGPITSIQPVGGFELIRGRLSILGQRITFDEGRVTLVGDLDPYLNFVARSVARDTTVFINVTGRVSDLNISFSSQPELPEDEVLARLIFNRSISELTPLQIARLAAAASELAGGSNTSLLGSLREATGLDDLDVVTDSEGNVAVRAGRYVQENIYLGVEAGAGGTTRGTVNLDITEELKARGSVGTGGDSSLGIFFEKDY